MLPSPGPGVAAAQRLLGGNHLAKVTDCKRVFTISSVNESKYPEASRTVRTSCKTKQDQSVTEAKTSLCERGRFPEKYGPEKSFLGLSP